MSEYKPGTVAAATVRGVEGVRVFRRYSPDTGVCDWAYNPDPSRGLDYSCDSDAGNVVTDVRPLVVLDLDPTVITEDMGARRNEAQRLVDMLRETADNFFTPDAARLARKVADQIEAQTKPPRIPEPGLWGVVEARRTGDVQEHKWIRDDGGEGCHWTAIDNYGERWIAATTIWDGLIDPTLVREGVES